jgi:hypothetical protein
MAGASAAGVVDVIMGSFFNDNAMTASEEAEFMRPSKQLRVEQPDDAMALQDYGYQGLSADPYESAYANNYM